MQLLGIWDQVVRLVVCKHCYPFIHYDVGTVNVFNVYDTNIVHVFCNNMFYILIVYDPHIVIVNKVK